MTSAQSLPSPLGHVALVMAKEGSTGLPGKNLLIHDDRSLLVHTLEAIESSGAFERVYVSTNGDEVADQAARCGATLIQRGDGLAANERYVDAVNHAVKSMDLSPKTVTIPMVVQPLRERGIFRRMLASHRDGVDSVVTVTPFESCVDWIFKESPDGLLAPCENIAYERPVGRRSDLCIIDNAVVSFTYESWERADSLTSWPYLGRKIIPIVQQRENANYFVDINNPDDAEWLRFVSTFPDWRRRQAV